MSTDARCRETFQSTPPARGATNLSLRYEREGGISIHAPREGGDRPPPGAVPMLSEISIHAPREGGDASAPPHENF